MSLSSRNMGEKIFCPKTCFSRKNFPTKKISNGLKFRKGEIVFLFFSYDGTLSTSQKFSYEILKALPRPANIMCHCVFATKKCSKVSATKCTENRLTTSLDKLYCSVWCAKWELALGQDWTRRRDAKTVFFCGYKESSGIKSMDIALTNCRPWADRPHYA